jgi:hypothetical protein
VECLTGRPDRWQGIVRSDRINIWDLDTETVLYDSNLGGDDTANPAAGITSGQVRIQK